MREETDTMATKAQLINFIIETFEEADGKPITKADLDRFKKAELEEFVKEKGAEAELEAWLAK